jgi:hypothetical protein
VYWPGYDHICHRHGPGSRQAADEVAAIDLSIGRLAAGLPRGRSALVILADHGQLDLHPDQITWLEDEPQYLAALASRPAGEARVSYLRLRPGAGDAARRHLDPVAEVVTADQAWAGGLFGGPPASETYRERVGDLIAVPRDGGALGWSAPDGRRYVTPGVHGGWSETEMRVPVLTVRI